MDKKCPGTELRNLKVEIIKCSNCGYEIEIFSDEVKVRCPKCKTEVFRENIPSCVSWCIYAKECIGEEKYNQIKNFIIEKQQKMDVKEKVLLEMMNYFKDDLKRIEHARKVLMYAEKILEDNPQADRNVVVISAILHDIGIKEAERKYGSADGQLQEKEGPAVAKEILQKLGVKKEVIDEVCQIIASHHSPGEVNTLNFKIIWDADWLVNLKDEVDINNKEKLKGIIDKVFMTDTGKRIAKEIYLR